MDSLEILHEVLGADDAAKFHPLGDRGRVTVESLPTGVEEVVFLALATAINCFAMRGELPSHRAALPAFIGALRSEFEATMNSKYRLPEIEDALAPTKLSILARLNDAAARTFSSTSRNI